MANYMAVDVGGTNVKYSLMTDQAEILEKGEFPTPYDEGLQDGEAFIYPDSIRMNLALPLSQLQEAMERLKKYAFI